MVSIYIPERVVFLFYANTNIERMTEDTINLEWLNINTVWTMMMMMMVVCVC